jgi:RimJ/RimL family protein N-acetyltransferase
MVELVTARLQLRPVQMGDEAILWPDIADPEICRYMAWQAHREPAQTEAFVISEVQRQREGRGITWLILDKAGAFCGIISVLAVLRRHQAMVYNRGELAYWLTRRAQGRGLMQEAIAVVLDHCFTKMELHKLVVSHFSNNAASEKLIRRSGFRYIGELVDECQKDGIWHSFKLYELLESEYRVNRSAPVDRYRNGDR